MVGGARGTWDLSAKRPDLIAAVLPMSGVTSNLEEVTNTHVTTPVWLFQGGLDVNPSPSGALSLINTLKSKGGNPRYTLYPNTGHGTWNLAYAEPEFFSWMLLQDKRNIYVFGGNPQVSQGDTLKMGFSAGFQEYQWTLNGINISGATGRFVKVTQAGNYTVKFKRNDNQWYESFPVNVLSFPGDPTTPTAPANLAVSNISGIQATLHWTASTSSVPIASYEVFLGTTLVGSTTTTSYLFTNLSAGVTYTVGVRAVDSQGNRSTISNISFTTVSETVGAGVAYKYYETTLSSLASFNFSTAPTKTGVVSNFDLSVRNRNDQFVFSFDGYLQVDEIGTYTFYTSSDDGSRLFIDNTMVVDNDGLHSTRERSGTYTFNTTGKFPIKVTYFENAGGQILTVSYDPPGAAAKQVIPDNKLFSSSTQGPAAPTNLAVSNISGVQATLSWATQSVSFYEVFLGTTLVGSTTTTSYLFTNLSAGVTYTVGVRAVDSQGNRSTISNISFTTVSETVGAGVAYKYYETALSSLASFNFSTAPTKTGVVSNFDLSVRNRNDQFVFSFDGYLQVDEIGAYTFYTSSDDGSRLFIDNTMVVDNDGLHGVRERSGTYTFSTTGKFPIKVTFFENTGGQVLTVSYDPPGAAAKQVIPDNKLFLDGNVNLTTLSPQENRIGESTAKEISTYPNPFTNSITIDLNNKGLNRIDIIDALNFTVRSYYTDGKDQVNIDLSDLPSGIYLLSTGKTKIRILKK